jgi:hypothetical protein
MQRRRSWPQKACIDRCAGGSVGAIRENARVSTEGPHHDVVCGEHSDFAEVKFKAKAAFGFGP